MNEHWAGRGLTAISLDDLKTLLRYTHRGELRFPLSVEELTRVGLQHVSDRVELLRGLDERAVRAVLVAAIAERTVERPGAKA